MGPGAAHRLHPPLVGHVWFNRLYKEKPHPRTDRHIMIIKCFISEVDCESKRMFAVMCKFHEYSVLFVSMCHVMREKHLMNAYILGVIIAYQIKVQANYIINGGD